MKLAEFMTCMTNFGGKYGNLTQFCCPQSVRLLRFPCIIIYILPCRSFYTKYLTFIILLSLKLKMENYIKFSDFRLVSATSTVLIAFITITLNLQVYFFTMSYSCAMYAWNWIYSEFKTEIANGFKKDRHEHAEFVSFQLHLPLLCTHNKRTAPKCGTIYCYSTDWSVSDCLCLKIHCVCFGCICSNNPKHN